MTKIAIIGLGYVGLPLAVEFGKKFPVIGFDINNERIAELQKGYDRTLEVEKEELLSSANLTFASNIEAIKAANIYIVTVPTPIDKHKSPDLTPLLKASETVGKVLSKGDIVIYESTVYPGCTEEDCVPVLEKHSGLKYNVDFFCGYSPERINPGDKINTLTKIRKVTSGSTPEIAIQVDELYKSIIVAGTHLAPNMKVAEASKAIENAQRDVNISFVNELALIFDKLGIDTSAVLEAAGTKWNFLKFKPGLVGGHCIGVDPYYLAHKAESVGYHPAVILSGRRVNDYMGRFVAQKMIKLMTHQDIKVKNARVLMLGITFKENCPDVRNTKVVDILHELEEFGVNVETFDPWAEKETVHEEYGINLVDAPTGTYDGIILAVSHHQFENIDLKKFKKSACVIFDTKAILPQDMVDARL